MKVEQEVGAIVERPQLARTRELARCARAVENLGVPQPVEVLVEAARGEGIAGVERLVSGSVGEDQRQRAARRPEAAAQQPVERDRAAHFVAVRQRLDRDARRRRASSPKRQTYGHAGVARGPSRQVRQRDIDRREPAGGVECHAMQRCCASRSMNASQRASCSRLTHSFGWCACSMWPGPQMTAGIDALWNSAASVPNDTLCVACASLHARPIVGDRVAAVVVEARQRRQVVELDVRCRVDRVHRRQATFARSAARRRRTRRDRRTAGAGSRTRTCSRAARC